ncbi:MAG: homoserine dehydrogenase [Sphingomicrobium sp.]
MTQPILQAVPASITAAEGQRLCVLKFGSSVLGAETDYAAVALEIYRHVRQGEKVVAVVSALHGETDALLSQGARVGGDCPALLARLARVGELRSAALAALALNRVGVRVTTMDPHEMGLLAEGQPLDSNLTDLDAGAVWAKLRDHEVVVVPGFTAGHAEHGVVTLGRGGTDLSAVFFADRLGAHRARLIKDVDGVYAEDPVKNPHAERYSEVGYAEAAAASSGLIQPKAILAAQQDDVLIEVAAMGAAQATTIANLPARKSLPLRGARLRVALLGCGTVGGGVLAQLLERPDLFELNPVLVRRPADHAGEAACFTSNPTEALAGDPDIVVELVGGADPMAELVAAALRNGASLVTANKALVAQHHDLLAAAASAGGASLLHSGAVGGGVPVLEAIGRLRTDGGVSAVEGIMNGTSNFILGRLEQGCGFDEAVHEAQALGFAEAEPSADIDGHDTAHKLSLLARACFGNGLSVQSIARQSLRGVSIADAQAAHARGEVLKQIGRCWRERDGGIVAAVRIESLPVGNLLARARGEENVFVVTATNGCRHTLHGKGAGRWPTAASVFADIMDLQRASLARNAAVWQGGG